MSGRILHFFLITAYRMDGDKTIRWDQYAARWLRERLGYILLIIYMLLLCVAIPLSVNELVNRHAEVSNRKIFYYNVL